MVNKKENAISTPIREQADYIQKRYIINAKENGEGFVTLASWEKFDENIKKYFEDLGYIIVQTKKECSIVWDQKWEKYFREEAEKKKIIYKVSASIFVLCLAILMYQLYMGIKNAVDVAIIAGVFYAGKLALVNYILQYDDETYITQHKEK